jgi:hypothetical protein
MRLNDSVLSTCKNVVMSHGSFSAVIGYLSFSGVLSNTKVSKVWYSDMFSVGGCERFALRK